MCVVSVVPFLFWPLTNGPHTRAHTPGEHRRSEMDGGSAWCVAWLPSVWTRLTNKTDAQVTAFSRAFSRATRSTKSGNRVGVKVGESFTQVAKQVVKQGKEGASPVPEKHPNASQH